MNLDIESYNKMQKLFLSIISSYHYGEKYLSITNLDGKTWVIPEHNMKTAMNLYQPSAIKGKILRKLLPLVNLMPFVRTVVRKALHVKSQKLTVNPILLNRVVEVFASEKRLPLSKDKIELSFFLGTPSVHQKIIIQVSIGTNVLGYCKITESDEIKAIFYHEQDILSEFHKDGVNNVPTCLYCGKLEDDSFVSIFIQSTVKTNRSKVIHDIRNAHFEFLKSLVCKTQTDADYLSSDYHTMIEGLKENLDYLSVIEDSYSTDLQQNSKVINIVKEAIKSTEQILSRPDTVFSAYHGDFTPWNMFFEKEELCVFDLEYAKKSYPPLIDIFHYFTQTCIFKKGLDTNNIYHEFEKHFINDIRSELYKLFKCSVNAKQSYIYYLLDIIALYLNRDKGNFNRDVERNLKIWVALLEKLAQK